MANNIDEELYGVDLFGEAMKPQSNGELAERFMIPPFSVLNAREGNWQNRKRAWINLGIKSELGRGENVTFGDSPEITTPGLNYYRDKYKKEQSESSIKYNANADLDEKSQKALGCYNSYGKGTVSRSKAFNTEGNISSVTGTSIFDPVLCELMYRWFCPAGGQVIDPFAGGSVRGIVAAKLGLRYWGSELRPEQVKSNYEQSSAVCPDADLCWECGDADKLISQAPDADFILSCPPYGDLEIYSDDPADLSNMEYHTFIATYRNIIRKTCARLKNNRLACFVVGDFRDKKTGYYRNFVSATISAFIEAGLGLYNEAILITCVGSLPVRVSSSFASGRKLGKTHQNILVFAKDNPKKMLKLESM